MNKRDEINIITLEALGSIQNFKFCINTVDIPHCSQETICNTILHIAFPSQTKGTFWTFPNFFWILNTLRLFKVLYEMFTAVDGTWYHLIWHIFVFFLIFFHFFCVFRWSSGIKRVQVVSSGLNIAYSTLNNLKVFYKKT